MYKIPCSTSSLTINLDKIETLCLSNVTDPIILDLDHRQVRNFELEDSSLKHN